jgi:hypothetical protein
VAAATEPVLLDQRRHREQVDVGLVGPDRGQRGLGVARPRSGGAGAGVTQTEQVWLKVPVPTKLFTRFSKKPAEM